MAKATKGQPKPKQGDGGAKKSVPIAEQILERYPRLARAVGWITVISAVASGIATVLGKLKDIQKGLMDLLGSSPSFFLHYIVAVVVFALILVGFFSLWLWIYKRFLSHLAHAQRLMSFIVFVFALVAAGVSANSAIPDPPSPIPSLKEASEKWRNQILAATVSGGGILYNLQSPEDGPQVWATAQSITGILVAPGALARNDFETLRRSFIYIESVRLPNARAPRATAQGLPITTAEYVSGVVANDVSSGEDGWGYMANSAWGVTEINAWVALAYISALKPDTAGKIWPDEIERDLAAQHLRRELESLLARQTNAGNWSPIKETGEPKNARTYSTTMALWAILEARAAGFIVQDRRDAFDTAVGDGIRALVNEYKQDLQSWVPNASRTQNTERFEGLTAQVLFVLARAQPTFDNVLMGDARFSAQREAFLQYGSGLSSQPKQPLIQDKPVTDNARVHDSDRYLINSPKTAEGSTYLWFPWSLALCAEVQADTVADAKNRAFAKTMCERLVNRAKDIKDFADSQPFTYLKAESLFAINWYFSRVPESDQTGYNYFRDLKRWMRASGAKT